MPDFKVCLVQSRDWWKWVTVDAETQQQADDIAIEFADDFSGRWQRDHYADATRYRINKRHRCIDCGTDTAGTPDYYHVRDLVWAQSGLGPDGGMLCLACLAARIGRDLTLDDFDDAPINANAVFNLLGIAAADRWFGSLSEASRQGLEHCLNAGLL